MGGGSPIRPRHKRRDDVGREERGHEQKDVLHPMERPEQDECRDGDSSHGHRGVAAHPCEIQARGHTGELGAGRADVRDEKREHSECCEANSVPLAHETRQPLSGDDAHARTELVEEDERERREVEDPQELVAVVGPEDRIRGDARCVVVRQPGQAAPDRPRRRARAASYDGAWRRKRRTRPKR